MKKLLLFFALGFLVYACDENQKVVKELDGTWDVKEHNGKPDTGSNQYFFSKFTFNECKLKDNEYCDGSLEFTGGFASLPIEYTVQSEGEEIGFKLPSLGSADSILNFPDEILLEIVKLEGDILILQNEGTVLDLEKVE